MSKYHTKMKQQDVIKLGHSPFKKVFFNDEKCFFCVCMKRKKLCNGLSLLCLRVTQNALQLSLFFLFFTFSFLSVFLDGVTMFFLQTFNRLYPGSLWPRSDSFH